MRNAKPQVSLEAYSARRATRTRTFTHSFYHLLQAAKLIDVLSKDDKFIKLCTILEKRRTTRGEVLHSATCRGSKLRGDDTDEFRPAAKAFDIVLTSDRGAVSVRVLRDIGDDEQD